MSIRIVFDNPPEFFTNLDSITGKIFLDLSRSEQIGAIVAKLEGESISAVNVPRGYMYDATKDGHPPGPPGSISTENHKILYKVASVFPDDYYASSSTPYGAYPLPAGHHEFPFKFKLPLNNGCGDVNMAKIGGAGGLGGYGPGMGLFGMGSVRVMDGTKQLYLRHVTSTLPPSLSGFPGEAEIRYYIKVTVQRPGILRENWRHVTLLKFLPIEPPRPEITGQEVFARRPFTFRPRSASLLDKKKNSLFGDKRASRSANQDMDPSPPSVQISALMAHPVVLTCNHPVPLRLLSKKLVDSRQQLYLVSLQVDLIGITEIRAHGMINKKVNRWVVVSNAELKIPLGSPEDEVGKEFVFPDDVWRSRCLPNTVSPSFNTCNLSRTYQVEVKIGVSWFVPTEQSPVQTIYLPLHFDRVQVYSGITPPTELVTAARVASPRLPPRRHSHSGPSTQTQSRTRTQRPDLPPRQAHDPLYPPQLQSDAPAYDDAPPSYDEAMAENLSGPFDGLQSRPAYSGVTDVTDTGGPGSKSG